MTNSAPITEARLSPSALILIKIGCLIGMHYSGTTDGGGMGDAMRCDWCKLDKYPEAFMGTILRGRSLSDPKPAFLSNLVKKDEKSRLVNK